MGDPGFVSFVAIGFIDSATRMGFLTLLPFLLIAKGASITQAGFALSLVFAAAPRKIPLRPDCRTRRSDAHDDPDRACHRRRHRRAAAASAGRVDAAAAGDRTR